MGRLCLYVLGPTRGDSLRFAEPPLTQIYGRQEGLSILEGHRVVSSERLGGKRISLGPGDHHVRHGNRCS